ncbi:MAG: HD domain-containing protein [Candidatus Aenigmarchaeota archaeon]|nr:HD domain-containing protein [Candidatus Aenigmarchaeota archaeon]
MEERTRKIISFLQEIEKCKLVERKVYCSDLKRRESDAEHSWHLAMFLVLFEKNLPKELDLLKMLKMALVHDLAEIYAGDIFAFDTEGRKGKKEREERSAEKLFSGLPEDLKEELWQLFGEFEEAKTSEAKVVQSFDKLQPILQNLCSNGLSWKENSISVEDVNAYKKVFMEHDPFILDLYRRLLSTANEKKLMADKPAQSKI